VVTATVEEWTGRTLDAGPGDVAAERGYVLHWCESVEDANPIYWDEAAAAEITDGWIAPPSMLSVWMRPLMFNPTRQEGIRPLELHFQLKEAFELPDGIVTANEIEFREPVRMGDVISTRQTVREISEVKTNRLGAGRAWIIDVTYANQRGEVVGIESYEMFSYVRTSA
jgi:acyl dehydratase